MKRSKKPTEYIIIKANTNSEWDSVEFVIIHLSPEWLELTKRRLAAIKEFKENDGLNHHCYWDAPLGYYNSPPGQNLSKKIFPKYDDWAFITLDPEEENTLPVPENSLDAHQLMITKNGIVQYKAYGKHTSEEFWTEEFNLLKVITKL
jgi:hypothetical protein